MSNKDFRTAHKGYPGKVKAVKRPHIFEDHKCVLCGLALAWQREYGEDCYLRIKKYETERSCN